MKEKAKKLKITYDNTIISNLTVTRILFINRGNEVINSNDIAPKEPLRIVFISNPDIFEFKILYIKQKANNISFTLYNNQIYLNFDYLSYNEGCILQVVHSSDSDKIHIKGIIKGINKLNKFKVKKKESEELILGIFCYLSMVIGVVLANIFANAKEEFGMEFGLNIETSIHLILFILILLILVVISNVLEKNSIPGTYISSLSKD
ncbi:MAG: hypothetical protein AAF298_01865 [Cyanobacteria bacterium P01_A01_bin.40]